MPIIKIRIGVSQAEDKKHFKCEVRYKKLLVQLTGVGGPGLAQFGFICDSRVVVLIHL